MTAPITLAQHKAAETLDKDLGDVFDPSNLFSFQQAVDRDERDEYPEAALSKLFEQRFHYHVIPGRYGGKLNNHEEMMFIGRVLARRDMTLFLVQATTWLASLPVYVGGSETLKQRVAALTKNKNTLAFGLSEKAHGADLLASDVRAEPTATGYTLSGEKWMINNGTRGAGMVVLARSADNEIVFFFLDKTAAPPECFRHLPKIRTLGVRGIDLSGIALHKMPMTRESIIGGQDVSGLNVAIRGVQVSRTIVPTFSLACMDTALRATMDLATHRVLYGKPVFEIPHAQQTMVEAFADHIIGECVAVGGARCVHVTPEQLLLWGAVTKYYVPTLIDSALRKVSTVLGARFYLRDNHWGGVFQKLQRDAAIAAVFDGSTVVNQSIILSQLQAMMKHGVAHDPALMRNNLKALFQSDTRLPPFDYAKLVLTYQGREDVTGGLPEISQALETLGSAAAPEVAPGVLACVTTFTREVRERLASLMTHVQTLETGDVDPYVQQNQLYIAAERFCTLFAAACVLHTWLHNRAQKPGWFASGHWVVVCLHRLLSQFDPMRAPLPRAYSEIMAVELRAIAEQDRLFSLWHVQLQSHANAAQARDALLARL